MNIPTTTQPLIKAVKRVAWGTIIFLIALNVVDLLIALGIVLIRGNSNIIAGLNQVTTSNGWAYIIAGAVGIIAVIGVSRSNYQKIFSSRQSAMTWKRFLLIVLVLFAFQFGTIIFSNLIEMVLNPFHLSAMKEMQKASQTGIYSVSMMVYSGVFAPIFEELVFRGFALKKLQPFGIKFALIISSLMFACAHGNIIQGPFAFITGMLLGMIATRYGIKWSIITHIFNNLGLSIGMQLLSQKFSWISIFTIGLAIIGIGLIIVKAPSFIRWWKQNRIQKGFIKLTFTRLSIIIVLIYGIALALSGIQHV